MNSPDANKRDESVERKAGASFYRHLLIWFFYRGDTWFGTASELLGELKAGAAPGMFKFESWPDTPNDVCEYLTEHKEALHSAGLDVRVDTQAGLRMIGITWVDGIRRQPPIAVESNSASTLPEIQTGGTEAETVIREPKSMSGLNVAKSADDATFESAASLPDDNPDHWEHFRNVPTRFRIDEDGRRRRRLAKMALATVLVALVFAIVLWARHQLREAWVRMPVVYGELRPAKAVTDFLSRSNAMATASAIPALSNKFACREESDG